MIIKITFHHDVRCLFKSGDKVKFGQPFLESKEKKQAEINIAKELGIQPKKIFRYLKKFVGDSVNKDEIIAIKKDFFNEKKILCPFRGIIKEVDHDLGKITLTIDEKDKKIVSAYFQGEVIKIKDGILDLLVDKASEYPIKKTEFGFGGQTFYLNEEHLLKLSNNMINKKIIITENVLGPIQSKIEALGSIGLVFSVLPNDQPSISFAVLKDQDDFKKIRKDGFSYCYIDQLSSKIFFYE